MIKMFPENEVLG